MIVSASYRTDIPAFHARWFANRLRAGYCKVVHPFDRSRCARVSLAAEDVDGFVFWTRNIGPFLGVLSELRARGRPFVVQYTITGYPRALESRVVDARRSVERMRFLSRTYGGRVAVWRYDAIVLSDLTPPAFHRANFRALASALAGATDEAVVSFMQVYKKTRVRMDRAAAEGKFRWEDPPPEAKRALLSDLAAIAAEHGMRLTICSQPDLAVPGAGEARCVDADRLMEIGGRPFRARRKGHREGCGCFESRDVGDYDSCLHGCAYCYAVRDPALALARLRARDPEGEFLLPVPPAARDRGREAVQLRLFDRGSD